MSSLLLGRRYRRDDEKERYKAIVEQVFLANLRQGARDVDFCEAEIKQAAKKLGIRVRGGPRAMVSSFRDPDTLPQSVRERAPRGHIWLIRSAGQSRYRFVATRKFMIPPREMLAVTHLVSCSPDLVTKFALDEKQVLLSILRYDRLIDVFAGMSCYCLQGSSVAISGSVEQPNADAIYIGVDRSGAPRVFPVHASGRGQRLSVTQIERSVVLCSRLFPSLACAAIGAQLMPDGLIALRWFQTTENGLGLIEERHYRLMSPNTVTSECLSTYRPGVPAPVRAQAYAMRGRCRRVASR